MFTQQMIDKHIINQENAHFGQNLTKNGVPQFNAVYLNETKEMRHGATKEYVDTLVNGIQWRKSVMEIFDFSGERIHNQYDRYISMCDYKNWRKNYIYEFDGNNWEEETLEKGIALYVEDGNIFPQNTILFNGSEWIKFGSTTDHNALYNTGKYSHQEIDRHINDEMGHFGQNLTQNGTPSFESLKISNSITSNINEMEKCKINNTLQIGNFILPRNDNVSVINNGNVNVCLTSVGETNDNFAKINFNRAFGDVYSPQSIGEDTIISSLSFGGYDGKEYCQTCGIQSASTENFTENNHGSRMDFYTTENNTNTKRIVFQIDNDGRLNSFCKKEVGLNIEGGINSLGNITTDKTINASRIEFHGEDEISMIANKTNDNINRKITSICGGSVSNTNRGGIINISGNDSNLDGTIQIKSGKPNGRIELTTNNKTGIVLDKTGMATINNINCLYKMALPRLYTEPKEGEIGEIYYDMNTNKVKVCTPMGYRTIVLE